jgi:hypothetical protein
VFGLVSTTYTSSMRCLPDGSFVLTRHAGIRSGKPRLGNGVSWDDPLMLGNKVGANVVGAKFSGDVRQELNPLRVVVRHRAPRPRGVADLKGSGCFWLRKKVSFREAKIETTWAAGCSGSSHVNASGRVVPRWREGAGVETARGGWFVVSRNAGF